MSYDAQQEFEVLHALKVKGMSAAPDVAEATGLPDEQVQEVLDATVDAGLARHRTGGRVEGYMLTKDGRARHLELRDETVSADEIKGLAAAYDAFLGPNRDFKQITTDWQTEAAGDVDVVLPRLTELNERLHGVLDTASGAVPRMARYQPRFDRALDAFRGGETTALAKPMSGSYHDVWMELHEDMVQTLGRERTDADE